MKREFVVICIFLLFSIGLLRGQKKYVTDDFVSYSMKDGMTSNSVTSLAFDSLGYLWVGTIYGLNRFDGEKFKTFVHQSDEDLIPGNYITRIENFKGKHLYLITRSGFGFLNPNDLTFENNKIHGDSKLETSINKVRELARISEEYFAVSSIAGFYVLDNLGHVHFNYTAFNPSDFGKTRIDFAQSVLKINQDEFIVYVRGDQMFLYTLSKNTFEKLSESMIKKRFSDFKIRDNWTVKHQWANDQFIFLNCANGELKWVDLKRQITKSSYIPKEMILDFYWDSYIFPLSDSSFAVNCRDNGFYIFSIDKISGQIAMVGSKNLSEYRCHSIKLNADGRLFVGTDSGLLQEKSNKKFIRSINVTAEPIQNLVITDVLPLKNQLVIATWTNETGVLFLKYGDSSPYKKISFSKDIVQWNEIFYLRQINENEIWCFTNRGIVSIDLKKEHFQQQINRQLGFGDDAVFASNIDPEGNFVMRSSIDNSLAIYNINTNVLSKMTGSVQKEITRQNRIFFENDTAWFAGFGLTIWDIKNNKSESLDLFPDDPDIEFLGLIKVGDVIYLSTTKFGLIKYHLKTKSIQTIQANDKALIGLVGGMKYDAVNQTLLYWQNGKLVAYDLVAEEFTTFNYKDGIPEEPSHQSKIRYSAYDQNFYFSTENHLLSFTSDWNEEINSEIFISEIEFNNEQKIVHPRDEIKLSANDNSFGLAVTSLDYNDANLGCKYKIDDSPWIFSEKGMIHVLGLSPGRHIFSFSKNRNPEKFNQTFVIEIAPHFYKSWWFYILLTLLASSILGFFYKIKINYEKEKLLLSYQLVESEINALHSQMNPHFIFNCLNTIKSLILQGKDKEASRYLNIFSSLIRKNLEHSKKVYIPISEQVEYLKLYLQMEKLRFSNFNYTITVTDDIAVAEETIPAMILQPLVENAIWHGLQESETEKEIIIKIYKHSNRIFFDIDDNGVGIDAANTSKSQNGNSLALINIQKRIQLLNQKYHLDYQLNIFDKKKNDIPSQGTIARFSYKNSIE